MPFHPSVLIVGGVFIYAIAALWKLQDRDESNWPEPVKSIETWRACVSLTSFG